MINKEEIKELDSHWNEVMDLAKKYGFICQSVRCKNKKRDEL